MTFFCKWFLLFLNLYTTGILGFDWYEKMIYGSNTGILPSENGHLLVRKTISAENAVPFEWHGITWHLLSAKIFCGRWYHELMCAKPKQISLNTLTRFCESIAHLIRTLVDFLLTCKSEYRCMIFDVMWGRLKKVWGFDRKQGIGLVQWESSPWNQWSLWLQLLAPLQKGDSTSETRHTQRLEGRPRS